MAKSSIDKAQKRGDLVAMSSRDIKVPNDQIFVENSKYSRKLARARILRENLLPYVCSKPGCPVTDKWQGKPIEHQLHHINHISNDHRLENLCFLCPSCHSQTSSWSRRKNEQ